MNSATPSAPRWTRALPAVLLALIVATFATRNLPWHLDDYDQAKQAFVSFEMVETGHWWFQHTPDGDIATKPPLAGWISAGLYFLFGKSGWEFAWRLPSFAAALLVLAMLLQSGRQLAGPHGGLIAASAFGFNLLAPRIASLVRTDMLLTLLIFFTGWLILEKVRRREAWTTRDRGWLALAVLGAMLMKGPILYAFLLPGLAAYGFVARRRGWTNHAWAGAWPWFAPLLVFGVWVGVGAWLSGDFYRQVVLREFLGRFDMSDAPIHKHQPLWFYLVHVLHKWGPWSVALLALLCVRRVREQLRSDPALVWLACWALGGFLCMSLVPSKRVDRIFPIIPPLCLLLAASAREWLAAERPRQLRIAAAIGALGVLMSVGYTAKCVWDATRKNQRALVEFGEAARRLVADRPERFAVGGAKDEGLLLYTRQTRFTSIDAAAKRWAAGDLDRLIIAETDLKSRGREFAPHRVLLQTGPIENKHGPYFLIERESAAAHAPDAR
jgi:4-amino-4-deoxy-L-arabinose transferase-like glycosyltransferase